MNSENLLPSIDEVQWTKTLRNLEKKNYFWNYSSIYLIILSKYSVTSLFYIKFLMNIHKGSFHSYVTNYNHTNKNSIFAIQTIWFRLCKNIFCFSHPNMFRYNFLKTFKDNNGKLQVPRKILSTNIFPYNIYH